MAHRADRILREEFQAYKVVVFGSLARKGWFTLWSDIDLAVRGIAPEQFYRSVAAIIDLNQEFQIDLIDMETCPLTLQTVIEQEGVEL